jgi:hypothetical protein
MPPALFTGPSLPPNWRRPARPLRHPHQRRDIERAFDVLNRLNGNDVSIEANLRGVKQTLGEVCKAVEALEKKKPAAA